MGNLRGRLDRVAAEIAARTPPERHWPQILIPGPETAALLAELRAAGVGPESALPRPGERRLIIPDHDGRWDDGPDDPSRAGARSDAAAGEG